MAGMATEKQREHIKNYEAQRKAKGWVKATVWFSPEAVAALAKLKAVHGSKDAAINAALIRAAAPPVQDTAGSQKPAHKSLTKAAEADPKPKRARIAERPAKAASEPRKRQGVDVPVIGSFVRKPYQKGSAKPKGKR